jgi:hypothetical protein
LFVPLAGICGVKCILDHSYRQKQADWRNLSTGCFMTVKSPLESIRQLSTDVMSEAIYVNSTQL